MDKYTRQAFKITLMLFLAVIGLFAFLPLNSIKDFKNNNIPKSAFYCEFGKAGRIYHNWFGLKWELEAATRVDYETASQDVISEWSTQGSEVNTPGAGWESQDQVWDLTIGYNSNFDVTSVKNWGSARFYTTDGARIVDAEAWVKIMGDETWSWGHDHTFVRGGSITIDTSTRTLC